MVKRNTKGLTSALNHLPSPLRQEWRAVAFFSVILLFSAWAFTEVIEDMVWDDPFAPADVLTFQTLQGLRSQGLDRLMIVITETGDTLVVVAVAIAVAAWLTYKRAWHTLVYWVLAVGGGSLINSAIKMAMQRARPGDMHYAGVSVFSFPSGHSTTNAALYGFLLIIIARELSMAKRIPVIAAAVLFVGLIAFSRLYLGAHWLSDVGGGLTFACAWLALLGVAFMWRPAEPVEAGKLLVVVCLALALAGGSNIALNFSADSARYAVQSQQPHPVPRP